MAKDEGPKDAAWSAAGGTNAPPVIFVDGRGERWSVIERDTRNEPGARADCCLVFSGENTIRRVWKYSAQWRSLSPEELEALSARG